MNSPTIAPTPSSGKRNVAPFVVGGMILVVAVIALAAFGAFQLFRSGQRTVQAASIVSGNFLDAMQTHRYSDARALLMPDSQAKTPVANLRDIQQLLDRRHGAPKAHGPLSTWNINSYNGLTTVQLVMPERFADGDVPASLAIENTPNGWRIVSYNFSL